MSYILDALKKAEQQRKSKGIPSLPATQPVPPTLHKSAFVYYSVVVLILLGAGIAIGWMRPWQTEHSTHQTEPGKAMPPIDLPKTLIQVPPATQEKPSGVTSATQRSKSLDIDPQSPISEQVPAKVNLRVSSGVIETGNTPKASKLDTPQKQSSLLMSELPNNLQQEIPPLQIQMHAYSSNPNNRLVSINSKMLHEGDFLASGLRLENISPDGMTFSYKGYRFHHGIQ